LLLSHTQKAPGSSSSSSSSSPALLTDDSAMEKAEYGRQQSQSQVHKHMWLLSAWVVLDGLNKNACRGTTVVHE
jgi:hypothetical protein